MDVVVEIPDSMEALVAVRALEALLAANERVVVLRAPDLSPEAWNEVSEILVARAVAALHGAPGCCEDHG